MEEGSVLGFSAPNQSRDRLGGITKAVARPLGDSFGKSDCMDGPSMIGHFICIIHFGIEKLHLD